MAVAPQWADLPDNALREVLLYLPSANVAALSLTCRAAAAAARDPSLWREFCMAEWASKGPHRWARIAAAADRGEPVPGKYRDHSAGARLDWQRMYADAMVDGRLRRGPSVIIPPAFSFSMANPYG
jgi:hypothetical protein